MSQPMGNPGNMAHLPSSSNFGIPTAWDFSKAGTPMGMFCIVFVVVLALIAMHLFKGGRRR